jgi:hypothetical protein
MSAPDVPHEDVCSEQRLEPHLSPSADLLDYLREYAREKPEIVALWCLGIGFILGWKLKPW